MLLSKLNWMSIEERIHFKKAVLVYKSLNGMLPEYMKNMFKFVSEVHSVNLRSAANKHLYLEKPKSKYIKQLLSYTGSIIWNNLPHETRDAKTLPEFKRLCTQYILGLRSKKFAV